MYSFSYYEVHFVNFVKLCLFKIQITILNKQELEECPWSYVFLGNICFNMVN